VATVGDFRPCSYADSVGREVPARRASSSWVRPELTRTCSSNSAAFIVHLACGVSPHARPRVAASAAPPAGDAARALSGALAALRRAAGLTQPELAALTGYSVTTVGHAETGRLWQARAFWEKADLVLAAEGELTRRHDAYRAAATGPPSVPVQPFPPCGPVPAALVRVTLHWSDETETVLHPPSGPGTAA
jgi:hypothetical protein